MERRGKCRSEQAGSEVLGGQGIEAKPQAPLLLLLAVRALHAGPRPRGPPHPLPA